MRRDIINGGPPIVAGRRAGGESPCSAKNAIFRRRIGKGRPRRLGRPKKLLEKRAIIGGRGWGRCPSVLLRQTAAGRGERTTAFERSKFGRTRDRQRRALGELGICWCWQDVFLLCDCGGG